MGGVWMRTSLVVKNIPSASLETGCPKMPSSRTLGKLDMGAYAEVGRHPMTAVRLNWAWDYAVQPCLKAQTEIDKVLLSPPIELVPKWVRNLAGIQTCLVQVLRKPLLVCQHVSSQAAEYTRKQRAKDRGHWFTHSLSTTGHQLKKKHEEEKVTCMYNGAPL